jgi:uncharacterized metal-binding protein YceD (DUF177 family)
MIDTPRSDTPALSQPVVVARLPEDGQTFRLAPDEATRAALAREFGIVAIPALKASVTLTPDGRGGVRVGGHVDGTVRQNCVASLEPFDAPVSEEIEMHFVPEDRLPEARPGAEIEVGADELPDPLVNGVVDIGAVVSEFLALGIDPYPRKPDAVFELPSSLGAEDDSPFSALARLRPDEPKGEE